MKLLICGALSNYAIERYYLQYLGNLNNGEVEIFTAQNIFLEYYDSSYVNKLIFRLGYKEIYNRINKLFIEKVNEFKPDTIFIFKGMEIFPETLLKIKKSGILLANYNPDNPFIFTGRGSGNSNVTKSIGLYDIHFTYNLEIQQLLIKFTNKPVEFLPFGYDLSQINLDEIMKEPEIVKPCFLGNPDNDRASFIKELNKLGIKLDIFGNNWRKFVSSKQNNLFPAIYGNDFYKVLRQYRVQLNLMRIHNLESHNMRTFEIPAIGGIQLAPDTPEHRMFFEVDKEIFLFKNTIECEKKINELLTITSVTANNFRELAFLKSKNAEYSYKSRALFVYNILKSF